MPEIIPWKDAMNPGRHIQFVFWSLTAAVGLLVSCSPLPSEAEGKRVIQEQIDKRSQGRINLLSFQKINGQQRENRGVQYYVLEFEIQFSTMCLNLRYSIEYTESCWTSRSSLVAPIFSTQKIQEDDPTLKCSPDGVERNPGLYEAAQSWISRCFIQATAERNFLETIPGAKQYI